MEEVNLYNVHEYVNYQVLMLNTVIITWDTTNKKIHDLMRREELFRKNNRAKNCLWLNEVKRVWNWKQGEEMYLYIQINIQKTRFVVYTVEPNTRRNVCIKIDENGYLRVKKIISLDDTIFEKINCVYNDLLDEEDEPYVLK